MKPTVIGRSITSFVCVSCGRIFDISDDSNCPYCCGTIRNIWELTKRENSYSQETINKIKEITKEGINEGISFGKRQAYSELLVLILSHIEFIHKFFRICPTAKIQGKLESYIDVAETIAKLKEGI